VRAVTLENIIAQISHLRTHPSVAAAIAKGEMALHGWFVDIHAGQVLGLDGDTGHFVPLREDAELPVALPLRAGSLKNPLRRPQNEPRRTKKRDRRVSGARFHRFDCRLSGGNALVHGHCHRLWRAA
jgi:hypothetical protein